jgi:hypothetical protein
MEWGLEIKKKLGCQGNDEDIVLPESGTMRTSFFRNYDTLFFSFSLFLFFSL